MSSQDVAHKQESDYSIVEHSSKLLKTAILENAVITKLLPSRAAEFAQFAERIAVLKATEGIMMNASFTQKYGMEPQKAFVNIDHAQLFIASCLLTTIKTPDQTAIKTDGFVSVLPSCDIYRNSASAYRYFAGNMYRTRDDRFYHVHLNLNPDKLQDALSLPHDAEVGSTDYEKAEQFYQQKTMKFTAADLDHLSNDILKISGTTVYGVDEYLSSEHGIADADRQLWNVKKIPNTGQKPCRWPPSPATRPAKPLAGSISFWNSNVER